MSVPPPIKPPNQNLTETTESESKASEKPIPSEIPESVVEQPAEKTRRDAAKALKEQRQDK